MQGGLLAEVIEIARQGLHDQVVSRLRAMLVEGSIAPGAKLKERELCERLSVSRTPLREAIKLLAAEGLVELVPNRGAVAVKLTEADVTHSFEVLGALEALGGELAARRMTDAEFSELKALHYEMLAAYARKDLPGYYRLNARIHGAINSFARNPVLAKAYHAINARVQSLRFSSNYDQEKWKRAVKEHEQMLEALQARDGARLRALMHEHMQRKRDVVLDQMRAAPAAVRGSQEAAG
ncbi:MAG: GntR family transcriptional regulator [Ramlibacter sp.]|nr:GntR family transcriptional regulator [Ramlibacter sp.]